MFNSPAFWLGPSSIISLLDYAFPCLLWALQSCPAKPGNLLEFAVLPPDLTWHATALGAPLALAENLTCDKLIYVYDYTSSCWSEHLQWIQFRLPAFQLLKRRLHHWHAFCLGLLGMYCSTSHFCSAFTSSLTQSILIDNCYDSDMKVVGVGLLQCANTVIW